MDAQNLPNYLTIQVITSSIRWLHLGCLSEALLLYPVVYFVHFLAMNPPGNYYEKFVAVDEQDRLQLIFDNRVAIKYTILIAVIS